jgi:hypothetical protein
VDNSHTTYCNGKLLGAASSWNTADQWPCMSDDGNYVIAVDGIDGELAVGSGFGGFMATVATDDGRVFNSDTTWKCWVADGQVGTVGHRQIEPPSGWTEIDFDDSDWPNCVSFGRNDHDNTHWAPYIPPQQPPSCAGCVGHVATGILDEAQWIWTAELDAHNDVFARGKNTLLGTNDAQACVWDPCRDADNCETVPEHPSGMQVGYGKSPHAEGGCRSCTGDDMKQNGVRRCGAASMSSFGWCAALTRASRRMVRH